MVSSFDRLQPSPASSSHLLRGVMEAISSLLTGSDCRQAIATALATLGRATEVDRVYIFEVHPHPETGEPAASQRFEWVRDSVSPQIDNPALQNRTYAASGLKRWYELFHAGRSFGSLIRDLPPAEQRVLVDQDIQSILIVPIMVDGALWGVIGFDDCHTERQWTADEEAALQLMATSCGGAIARQQAEVALRQNEERYRAMLDAIPDLMFRIRRDGTYLDCRADKDMEILLPPSELIGKTVYDVLPPSLAAQRMEYVHRALETGEMQRFEYQLQFQRRPLANQLYRQISPQLATISEDAPYLRHYEARIVVSGTDEVLAIVRDITERKESELALSESEERFSKAFRSSPLPMTIATLTDGRLIDVNDSYAAAIQFTREEAIGHTVHELNFWNNPLDRDRFVRLLKEQGAVRNLELLFRRKSGEVRIGLISGEVIQIADEECVIDCTVDITEQRQADQSLWAAAERDRLLGEISLRIRQSLDIQQILNTTVEEVRRFLRADRVTIAEFEDGDGQENGLFAESLTLGLPSLLELRIDADRTQELKRFYEGNRTNVVNDVSQVTLSPHLQQLCREYHIRAALGVPLEVEGELFGTLVAHQAEPRIWQPEEIHLMERLATQVAIAVHQAQLYRQVQTLNAGLERQVSDRTAQLQQKMEELQTLNALKDEFLNAFSHDLKTPVMGISLVLKNLLNQPGESITMPRSVLERMVQSNDRQLDLITAMLQAHSAETRGLVLHYELVQLGDLMHQVAIDVEPLVLKNQATLSSQVPAELPPVNADPVHLRRVFENLITNSLNHNPPGIHISLGATVEQDGIRITVADNGIGISPEGCSRLFERYSRGSSGRHFSGIGLGLYLCRQIVIAHGGQIGVESEPGKGATFWLTLPLAIAPNGT